MNVDLIVMLAAASASAYLTDHKRTVHPAPEPTDHRSDTDPQRLAENYGDPSDYM